VFNNSVDDPELNDVHNKRESVAAIANKREEGH
jgi:hypothetical protein